MGGVSSWDAYTVQGPLYYGTDCAGGCELDGYSLDWRGRVQGRLWSHPNPTLSLPEARLQGGGELAWGGMLFDHFLRADLENVKGLKLDQ